MICKNCRCYSNHECVYYTYTDEYNSCEHWEVKQTEIEKEDVVNHPSHYNDGKIEVMDYIEDKQLNFARGNVIKYVSRAGKKDPNKELEDLKKASWYLNREIERLNKEAE